jgi:hypothetical protein
MGWLLFATLCTVWVALLPPGWRRSPNRSVEEFERGMDLLADTDHGGRWIVTPRKGMAFVGPKERAKERARLRRRRVFVFLLETIGLTALIGMVPPLRSMWYATAVLLGLLGAYVWLLVSLRAREAHGASLAPRATERPSPARRRYAADGASRTARPAFNGLPALAADDLVNIVVRPAKRVGVAGV